MLKLRLYLENYTETQDDEMTFTSYDSHFSESSPCNIYIVGSRPRVIIDNNFCEVENNHIKLLFKVQKGHDFQEIYGKIPLNRVPSGKIVIESNFPFSRFNLKDDSGYFFDKADYPNNEEVNLKASYALRVAEIDTENFYFSDLKALYIGKSLKQDKRISPVKRVKSHSRIQAVLNKCVAKYTDQEVYILLCSFVHKVDLIATSEELREIGNKTKITERIQKDLATLNANTELMTQISEAALIDYFNTKEFNCDFIGSFGRKTHFYYQPIIKSKLDYISLEIDTTKLSRIYTDSIEAKYFHSLKYFPKEQFKREINDHIWS